VSVGVSVERLKCVRLTPLVASVFHYLNNQVIESSKFTINPLFVSLLWPSRGQGFDPHIPTKRSKGLATSANPFSCFTEILSVIVPGGELDLLVGLPLGPGAGNPEHCADGCDCTPAFTFQSRLLPH